MKYKSEGYMSDIQCLYRHLTNRSNVLSARRGDTIETIDLPFKDIFIGIRVVLLCLMLTISVFKNKLTVCLVYMTPRQSNWYHLSNLLIKCLCESVILP